MSKRLDVSLCERGLAESREKAKALIVQGGVLVNGKAALKAGAQVGDNDDIAVTLSQKYVSRGGYKLEKAVELFNIDLTDCVCMDIGASTGGFSDCMLQHGAAKVYAVDVGHDQLADSLLSDGRVINMEQTNIRALTEEDVPPLDFASVDVSFISLTMVLPILEKLLKNGCKAVCLVKPQFEAGRENIGKNGVVHNSKIHLAVLKKIYDFSEENNFIIKGATFSPIKGPQGNIEYLYYIEKGKGKSVGFSEVTKIVQASHTELDK